MKKVLVLVAAVLMAGTTVNAEKRPTSEILSAAAKVLQNGKVKTTSAGQKLEIKILDNSRSQLSIVGYQNGSYVLVANDDAVPAIIGYSDSKAQFDPENMAPAFRWYLDMANKNIEECLANGTTLPKTKINPDYKQEVPMMCQTTWSQDDPYFRQTPINEDNDQHYVTGCVATAMAQAMKYYEYPEIGRGKVKYTSSPAEGEGSVSKVRFEISEESFDWANMLNEYIPYKFNDDQADAVSYLMKCTGGSVKMTYAAYGSGAYTKDAAEAFYVNFKYDIATDCYLDAFFTKDEWYDIAYHAMSDGCPLVFGASSSIGGQDAGHSFVVDGYNKDGLVHVNFGWAGDSDGYYSLLNMHGYDHGFEMIPLRLPQENSQIISMFGLWNENLKYNKSTGEVNAKILNASVRDFTGRIGVILRNLADGSEQMIGYQDYNDEPQVSGQYYNVLNYNATAPLPDNLADGEYRLYLGTKGKWMVKDDPTDRHAEEKLVEEPSWQPVRCPDQLKNSYIIKVNGGKATVSSESNPGWVTAIDEVITTNHTNDIVRVFDLQGRMIYTSKAADFRIADVPAEGVLIIKNGKEVRKVIK